MLRKERKWNYIKCSMKTTKAEKVWKTKTGKKKKCNKQKVVTNAGESDPPVSVITLNVNGLNIPNKRLSEGIKKQDPIIRCLKRNSD